MSSNRNLDLPSTPSTRPRVVGLAGSLRRDSRTRRALAVALEGARAAGASIELIDLRTLELEHFDAGVDTRSTPAAARLRWSVGAADGLLLATPEYHGGYSGVLKNALDHLSAEQLAGKPIGLVAVGGGFAGGSDALNGLRTVGRSLRAWVLPEQAAVPRAAEAFDAEGLPRDPELRARLERVGRSVAAFARLDARDLAG